MKNKMYCFDCDIDVVPNTRKEKNRYTVHKETFFVEETINVCPKCGEILIDEELDHLLENVYSVFLQRHGLTYNSFKEIRTKLNLSQELFSKALGWAKHTVIRYENKESIPQQEYLSIYEKLNKNPNEIISIIEGHKEKLGNDYYKILNKIKSDIDIKTINVFAYILEGESLYKTQIMKSLFAIDFLNYKKFNKQITNLKYAHCPYGPMIDNWKKIFEFLIQNKYMQFDSTCEEDYLKFISDTKFNNKLFTEEELTTLKYVKDIFKGKSSVTLSKWSHEFPGWINTKDGEIINLNTAKDIDFSKI